MPTYKCHECDPADPCVLTFKSTAGIEGWEANKCPFHQVDVEAVWVKIATIEDEYEEDEYYEKVKGVE